MPTAHQQLRYFAETDIFHHLLHHLTRLRYFQSEELIAIAILPLGGLEEPHQHLTLLLVAQRLHVTDDFLCCHDREKEEQVFDWILSIQSKTCPSDYLRISGYGSST